MQPCCATLSQGHLCPPSNLHLSQHQLLHLIRHGSQECHNSLLTQHCTCHCHCQLCLNRCQHLHLSTHTPTYTWPNTSSYTSDDTHADTTTNSWTKTVPTIMSNRYKIVWLVDHFYTNFVLLPLYLSSFSSFFLLSHKISTHQWTWQTEKTHTLHHPLPPTYSNQDFLGREAKQLLCCYQIPSFNKWWQHVGMILCYLGSLQPLSYFHWELFQSKLGHTFLPSSHDACFSIIFLTQTNLLMPPEALFDFWWRLFARSFNLLIPVQ